MKLNIFLSIFINYIVNLRHFECAALERFGQSGTSGGGPEGGSKGGAGGAVRVRHLGSSNSSNSDRDHHRSEIKGSSKNRRSLRFVFGEVLLSSDERFSDLTEISRDSK